MTNFVRRTIGDLTLNDIGRTHIRVAHQGVTIDGPLRAIDLDIDTVDIRTLRGSNLLCPGDTVVSVSITIGQITLTGLSRDHSCEVIA